MPSWKVHTHKCTHTHFTFRSLGTNGIVPRNLGKHQSGAIKSPVAYGHDWGHSRAGGNLYAVPYDPANLPEPQFFPPAKFIYSLQSFIYFTNSHWWRLLWEPKIEPWISQRSLSGELMASRSGNDNDLRGWVRDSKTVRITMATIHWIPTTARPRAQFKIHDLMESSQQFSKTEIT